MVKFLFALKFVILAVLRLSLIRHRHFVSVLMKLLYRKFGSRFCCRRKVCQTRLMRCARKPTTQQQLAIQALAISNATTQSVLALFR